MIRSQHRFFVAAALSATILVALAACTTSPQQPQAVMIERGPAVLHFAGTEHKENQLIGRFWSPVTKEFYAWSDVTKHMPRGGWLMLGEQHDHPDHHQIETFFTYFLAGQGILGHVVMEMVSVDQQYAIDRTTRAIENLRPQDIDWPEKGWPWPSYEQQVKTAMRLSKGLKAGDLSEMQKQNVRDAGNAIAHYSTEHSQYLAELIETSHCGMFSAEQAMPMVNMQIARDQLMAQQLTAYALADKVGVFIAGAGHVRADYGAPLWLADDVPVRTLLLVGVGESENPEDYFEHTFEGRNPAQLVFFVPGMKQVDYCARLGG